MKELITILFCLLVPFKVTAGSYIGLNYRIAYSYVDNSTFDLRMGPIYSHINSKNREIFTSVGFLRTSSRLTQEELNYKYIQSGIWVECGFYRPIIRSEIFRLSLGPDFSFLKNFEPKTLITSGNSSADISPSSYTSFSMGIAMPVNIDIILSEKLLLRLSSKVIYTDASYSNGTGGFSFEMNSVMLPSLMLYYRFRKN